jgi:putative oxidoreductase
MHAVALAGRIAFSLMFVQSGVNHFRNRRYMAEYAGQMGVPQPHASVLGSGAVIFAGAIMVMAGIWGDIGALLLAGFLVVAAFQMHPHWKMRDPQAKQQNHINFWKNISMAGGALVTAAWFMCSPRTLAVTAPLLSHWFKTG